MDSWVSSGLFEGTAVPVFLSWVGVMCLVCGVDGPWKTYFTVGLEYLILLYADLYRGAVKGFSHLVTSVGCLIFVMGMAGMVPGVMSWLEHLVLPVLLAFCFWGGIIVFGLCGGWREFCMKYIPLGMAPLFSGVIGCIEGMSVLARPVVLSVRLLVNMVLGTVVIYTLGALSVCCGSLLLLVVLGMFFLYEVGVCFFQSYVFSMLLGLYMKEIEWN
uniref:ATP synthase subunit a n=1 Tax=Tegillarca granosa TaxID=220873 RepID=A0A0A7CIW1_TEGGR|nr:ATP synthase F0 subunit 6 [Tegillarca granosa]AID49107.1 ATP synthase F0 subunit 6 [Tegillarca granosa]UAJ48185.1 ATP synthase F0 subunit 6 [Tegillarca granosa]